MPKVTLFFILIAGFSITPASQTDVHKRVLSGVVVAQRNEVVPGVTVTVHYPSGEQTAQTDASGVFSFTVPSQEPLSVRLFGRSITLQAREIAATDPTENLSFKVEYLIPPIHESLVIQANQLEPAIDRRNSAVYDNTLFNRDDQLLQTLSAGINAGQHEGGGKSLEIRRFGYNLDHGGVNGGLKVLVDNFQQNQGTQGHGQGYLGQLKSLTPELVDGVEILNGPFSAQYGDFSGLGVVHIRTRESLPNEFTLRLQGGSFNSFRGFFAYSPKLKDADAFLAYENSSTDGPFINRLRYHRDNITGNYTKRLSEDKAVGVKFNFGRNNFYSSGQIPLDEVVAGRLDRFGFVDPFDGGRVRTGVASAYYRQEWASGRTLKADVFLARSLFDLYSNFTFYLNDQDKGDEIQQHDSRLQEGANLQILQPYKFFGRQGLLTFGGNLHANQINVGLYRTQQRVPFETSTSAQADVTNGAAYLQNALDLIHGHLHLEAGLRLDYFRFKVEDRINPLFSGARGATRLQPKFSAAYAPTDKVPVAFYVNYGRGISSQDARGVVQNPSAPPIATTDFFQTGVSYNAARFSVSTSLFLIDRSNEQVYIPDDGSLEFAGPSRANGYEVKTSLRLSRYLSFNSGLTQVMNAFYRGTFPRVYVDSAPHTVANGGLTFVNARGLTAALGYRHTGHYRLDGEDARIRAAGLDVVDFNLSQKIKRWVSFNFSVDNLFNKKFYETQNYFESRLRPGDPVMARIHATPGYPFGVTAGLTFRFNEKQ